MAQLVMPNPGALAGRSPALRAWLTQIRAAAAEVAMPAPWQELIDALVVAGDSALAHYSE